VLRLGGKHLDAEGYDLLGLMTGSEGLLGVVTEVTVRILRSRRRRAPCCSAFPSSEQAGVRRGHHRRRHHSRRHGDDGQAGHHAAEDFVHAGYPRDVEALLIVELDGPQAEVDYLIGGSRSPRRRRRHQPHQRERGRAAAFWAGRKAAFPAVGRISPDYYCMDGTIPRARCPRC
jgi:glycolate oxidase